MNLELDEDFIKTIDEFQDKLKKDLNYKDVKCVESLRLGLSTHDNQCKVYFLTINLPDKMIYKLNATTRREWRQYTFKEQAMIISRYKHFCEKETEGYEIYFELTKNVNIHLHCLLWYKGLGSDLAKLTRRFFGVQNRPFAVDCKEAYDLEGLRKSEYLTNKKEKAYQSTNIEPIIKPYVENKNTIDELNKTI